MGLLDIVQDEDYRKCCKDLDYIKLAISNLRAMHCKLMLDLPLDYHSKDFDDEFIRIVDELERRVVEYEEKILD